MKKSFIITVDTEGDNLWKWKPQDPVATKNAEFIGRFQRLCNKYRFKPVYLTNWEMAHCEAFMDQAVQWERDGQCEIGVHLHAWNNPPITPPRERQVNGQDYLIEYPEVIMREKFDAIYSKIKSRTGIAPYSHRAGRWAMNDTYFKILKEYGIKVDCSHTPGINWSSNMGATRGGSDYTSVALSPSFIDGVLEVPMTIRRLHCLTTGTLRHRLKCLLLGKRVWLRPAGHSMCELLQLLRHVSKEEEADYVEFMIHSSELMPGGSPYFENERAVEKLYRVMDKVFASASAWGYEGRTLKEYYLLHAGGK